MDPFTPSTERTPFQDAELYDMLFRDLDFDREFYVRLAREARGPVLEVTCGTGRILLPCLQAGVDIDGLDLFPEMLGVLRRKAAELGLAPRLYQADMRDFTLPRRYALILVPFNGFVHNLTTDDQLQTLRACRKHLAAGGLLVLNVFFPGREVVCGPEGTPVLEHEVAHPVTGLPVRIYDTRTSIGWPRCRPRRSRSRSSTPRAGWPRRTGPPPPCAGPTSRKWSCCSRPPVFRGGRSTAISTAVRSPGRPIR
ncbi:MAG TPA: class I SAM-dependent methyltransferase [Thermoanaerobaculia bacterium]|jgi:SAM-dependent methyltransferase|nr:class I SAM-dependent methyltransferase [Thermoanaerobaculia bacterium]